jgi:transcriptional regulator GlxA family with amidase domain
MSPRTVAVLAYDGAQVLDITGPVEVFTAAEALSDGGQYRIAVVSADGSDVTTGSGLQLRIESSLAELDGEIDTLIVPGGISWPDAAADRAFVAALASGTQRAQRIASVCAGAFLLGAVGVLDGRRATTHWQFVEELAARHPSTTVEKDPIFVVDGPVMTSAGVTAGIDLALAMVEHDLGPSVARKVARYLVVFMQRPGGQAQFSVRLRTEPAGDSSFRELLDMIAANPAGDYRLPALSARVGYAERHVTRVFAKELGTTPARYVEEVRVEAARVLLETTDLSFEAIARQTGLGSPDTLRRSFVKVAGITPAEHRQRFQTTGV